MSIEALRPGGIVVVGGAVLGEDDVIAVVGHDHRPQGVGAARAVGVGEVVAEGQPADGRRQRDGR